MNSHSIEKILLNRTRFSNLGFHLLTWLQERALLLSWAFIKFSLTKLPLSTC